MLAKESLSLQSSCTESSLKVAFSSNSSLSSEELAQFFHLSSDLFAVIGFDGTILHVNSAFISALEYDSSVVDNCNLLDLIYQEDCAVAQRSLENLVDGLTVKIEHRTRNGSGITRWISWRVQPNLDRQYAIAIGQDITSAKEVDRVVSETEIRLNLINKILKNIRSGMSVDDVIRCAVEQLSCYFSQLRVAYSTIDSHGQISVIHAIEPASMPPLTGLTTSLSVATEYLQALRNSETIIVNDVNSDRRLVHLAKAIKAGGTRAMLDVPLQHSEQLVGLLCFDAPTVRIWSEHEILTLQEVADYLTVAIRDAFDITSRSQLEVALQKANTQLEQRVADRTKELEQVNLALQQRESELLLITEAIPQHVWTAQPNGEVDYYNQRWLNYTGITLEQFQKKVWEDLSHPDDLPRVRSAWNNAVQTGTEYQVESRIQGADGTYRWFLVQALPLRDDRGKIIKWYGTNTDISDRKQVESDLQRANQAKDDFLTVLSHELRTPLNPILGWARLLQTHKLSETKMHEAFATIERSAKQQAQLIDDLLNVARILRGKLTLAIAPVNLNNIVTNALETVKLAASAKSIKINLHIEEQANVVLGDAARLQQVVWNLLSNAIKFTTDGGQVDVDLIQTEQQLQLTVRDTGIGIPPDFLPYVFDYFRQADSSTTREFGGLGLGLAIVRQIIESHGGKVSAKNSSERPGAIFTVSLPIATTVTSLCSRCHCIQNSENLNDIHILIVDDDVETREFTTFALEQEGAKVTTVSSTIEALQIIQQSLPHILVSDIGMPGLDGYMLIQQIRSHFSPEDLPAIALTAYTGEVNKQRALAAGFQWHLAKPIDPIELIAIAARLAKQT